MIMIDTLVALASIVRDSVRFVKDTRDGIDRQIAEFQDSELDPELMGLYLEVYNRGVADGIKFVIDKISDVIETLIKPDNKVN